tara:strand:+ start:85 stop:561 length:477 start_codon:yes stop_codon:yes gene_type:complete
LNSLTKLCDRIECLVRLIGVALFATMIAVVFFEVVMRYVFNSPTFWSEALARFAMVWLVMLGLARGIRQLDNIRVDFLVEQMPPRIQLAAAWARYGAVLVFAAVMLIYGTKLAIGNANNINTGFAISAMWTYLSVPVSGALILLFVVELIAKGERGLF